MYQNIDPKTLAALLTGKRIVINSVMGTIIGVKVRDEAHCQGFLKRPILRTEKPPDASAEPYANTVPFFIRTAGLTCVQLDEVEVNGATYKGAGNVGAVFRLYDKGTAKLLEADNGTLIIVTWD